MQGERTEQANWNDLSVFSMSSGFKAIYQF